MLFTWKGALVVLAPALASPLAIQESLNLHAARDSIPSTLAPKSEHSSAQFKIEHPGFFNENIEDYRYEHLAFNIEVLNSEKPCGYGNISLNGLDLPQGHTPSLGDHSTFGSAVVSGITVSDGKTRLVNATWHFNCFIPEAGQLLNFTIHQIDGKPVASDAGFLLSFRQSPVNELLRFSPVILSADDKKFNVAEWTQPAASSEEFEKPHPSRPSYQELVEEIDLLLEIVEKQKKQLQEYAKLDSTDSKLNCKDARCAVETVVSKVKSAAKIVQSVFHAHTKPKPSSEQHIDHYDLEESIDFDLDSFLIPEHQRRLPLLALLFSVIFLPVLYGAWKCLSRRNKLSRKFQERLARREERLNKKLARRAAFRHRLNTWWQKMTHRQPIADEEKRVLVTAQETVLEDAMRTEIQQLRMAAQVVQSIVSPGESISSASQFSQPRRQDSLPSYHSDSEVSDILPAYDDYEASPFCGLVANGFQYARVGPDSTPDSSVVDVSPRSSGEFVRRKDYDIHF
ncbi:MAG: hypothetical protein M1829_005479 [Trizodia sp. TS-e1964]|nr:MAG: hypothetical protein M1829_005479 [Trizodia sp. TS-e1964]